MEDLYTRSGRLLQRFGNQIHSRSGRYLGLLLNGKVFDPDGRYWGTVVGDRVVHRRVDSAASTAASTAPARPSSVNPGRAGIALWGIEPHLAD